MYKTEIIPYEKWFTFCKRLFIVKSFVDVLNNIFHELKKKKKLYPKSFIKENLFIM